MTSDRLPRPKRYFVDTSEGYVHVQDCGEGDKVVVFVTVTSFGDVLLDQALPLMAQRGYRALAIDLMGYGLSDKRTTAWSIEQFADNIVEAAALAGAVPKGYVFGHFSGLPGIEIAARPPAGLKGVVLDGTPLIDAKLQADYKPGDGPKPTVWSEDGAHSVEFWKRALGLIKRLNPEFQLEELPSNLVRKAYLSYLSVASFEPNTFDGYVSFDVRSRMKEAKVPVQVMCSDTDWNLPHHQAYVDGIPAAREVRFPGVHPLHDIADRGRAGEYVEEIVSFFEPLV